MRSNQAFADDTEKVYVELEGIKIMRGRDWSDDEAFTFVLKGMDGAPMPEEANGQSIYEFDVYKNSNTLNIGIFGQTICFEAPGTYVYELSEKAGNTAGLIYDTYVSKITVEVTQDNEGKLVAKKTIAARSDMEVEAGVSGFVNQYESQMTYPGVAVVKTLYGRNMTPGEFAFNISCENPNANTKGILDSDANFKNDEKTAGETWIATEKLGNLVAAWDTDEDGTPTVSFENNYEEQKQEDQEEPKPEDPAEPKEEQKPEKPEEPKKEEPKEDQSEIAPEIGDESNLWQWGVLLTISVFAFIAGLKRKNANM